MLRLLHLLTCCKCCAGLASLQVRCVQIAIDNPAKQGEMRVFNQFTEMFRWGHNIKEPHTCMR